MADDSTTAQMHHAMPIMSLVTAVLALASSSFQSWSHARSIEVVQRNVLRAENVRTCRSIMDVFFQLRFKTDEANMSCPPSMELKPLVDKFGALATHLTHFREEAVWQLDTVLNWQTPSVAERAATGSVAEYQAHFVKRDASFTTLSDDCTKAAQRQLL
jgi:hypothetical protein